jgi:hypothetical protein
MKRPSPRLVDRRSSGLDAAEGIRYSRGTMQILDRKRLRTVSCSCYEVIRKLESA